jgi:hypothetical protein
VVWIREGFTPAPPHPEQRQLVAGSPDGRALEYAADANINSDELGEMTPAKAMMYILMGKTGDFSLPGIVRPPVETANSTTTDDNEQVVGIEVEGHWRAYRISEMQTPMTHVINDVVEGVPVTVTYCNRNNCTRVFTKPDEMHQALNIGIGGFRDDMMLLHIDHHNFSQNAPDIPLDDLEFERTTWKVWKSAHPDTKICAKLAVSAPATTP